MAILLANGETLLVTLAGLSGAHRLRLSAQVSASELLTIRGHNDTADLLLGARPVTEAGPGIEISLQGAVHHASSSRAAR
jgi:hypothetical protein